MDMVRISAYGIGGFLSGGMLGLGIISLLPIGSDFNLNWFFILPAICAALGVIAGVWLGWGKVVQLQPDASNNTGLLQNISGWTLAILITIGILAALIF